MYQGQRMAHFDCACGNTQALFYVYKPSDTHVEIIPTTIRLTDEYIANNNITKWRAINHKISASYPSLVLVKTTLAGSFLIPILASPTNVVAHSNNSIGSR